MMDMKRIVEESIDELNEELEEPIQRTEKLTLMGADAVLDSMDFVNLMVIIEDRIFDEFDKQITIVSEQAFSRKKSPFATIDSLAEYLLEIVGEQK